MLRGMQDAYYSIVRQINDYNSKEQKMLRAKKKLLTGVSEDKKTFKSRISTQKGLVLFCVDGRFLLKIPAVSSELGYTYTETLPNIAVSYEDLLTIIGNHRNQCYLTQIAVIDDLVISHSQSIYTKSNKAYLTGVRNNEIVFIISLGLTYGIVSIKNIIKNYNFLDVFMSNNSKFSISLKDYKISFKGER